MSIYVIPACDMHILYSITYIHINDHLILIDVNGEGCAGTHFQVISSTITSVVACINH